MRIDMWLDTCDPWSYLGLRHLRTAMSRCEHGTEMEVYLHAYLLDPDLEAALDKPRIVALVESGAADLEEVHEADERMRALGAREGIRFDFDSLIIAPTSRAHRVIAAAHDADIDNDTVAGPDSLHLKVAEALCVPTSKWAWTSPIPRCSSAARRTLACRPTSPPSLLATRNGPRASTPTIRWRCTWGVASVPTYVMDSQFLVDGHQTVTAFSNILATAWDNARKDHA